MSFVTSTILIWSISNQSMEHFTSLEVSIYKISAFQELEFPWEFLNKQNLPSKSKT